MGIFMTGDTSFPQQVKTEASPLSLINGSMLDNATLSAG